MNRIFYVFAVVAWVCSAQQQQRPAGATGGQGAAAGAPGGPVRELPSNERTGIDIDRYIGNPFASIAKVSHEAILTRSIFRTGDPYTPGDPGAVLEFRKDFSLATLLPKNHTPLLELPVQQILYIENGRGRLDNDAQ